MRTIGSLRVVSRFVDPDAHDPAEGVCERNYLLRDLIARVVAN
jgi:hypothetical protein